MNAYIIEKTDDHKKTSDDSIHKQHTTNACPRLEFINRLTQAMHHILQKQFRRVYQELYYRERRDLFNVVKTSFRKMSRYFVLFYSEKRRFLVVPNRSKGQHTTSPQLDMQSSCLVFSQRLTQARINQTPSTGSHLPHRPRHQPRSRNAYN